MSRSEKMRYIPAMPFRYDIKQHVPELEKVLSAQSDTYALRKLKRAVDSDYMLYEMAAEFLPLSHEQTLALLKGYIAFQIGDLYVIPEAIESDIEKIPRRYAPSG